MFYLFYFWYFLFCFAIKIHVLQSNVSIHTTFIIMEVKVFLFRLPKKFGYKHCSGYTNVRRP